MEKQVVEGHLEEDGTVAWLTFEPLGLRETVCGRGTEKVGKRISKNNKIVVFNRF